MSTSINKRRNEIGRYLPSRIIHRNTHPIAAVDPRGLRSVPPRQIVYFPVLGFSVQKLRTVPMALVVGLCGFVIFHRESRQMLF